MSEPQRAREPAFNLPRLVTAAILLLLLIQGGREFMPDNLDFELVLDFGFIPGPWSLLAGAARPEDLIEAVRASGGDPQTLAARLALAQYLAEAGPPGPWTPLTYSLLHGSWAHVGLNCVWLAAFGSPVVRRIGSSRAILLALLSSLAGAAVHWATHRTGTQPVIGASAVVSGFMGAAATFVFNRAARERLFDHPEARRRATLADLVRNRAAILFLLTWFAINMLSGFVAGPLGITDGTIAWEAHIGGLLAGLVLLPLLDPVPAGEA